MTSLKLYGIPLSQPFRSVAWTLLQGRTRFEIQLVVPGATPSIGSQNEAYLSKTRCRTDKIPILQDGNFVIAESPAILSYLCERYGLHELYGPPGSQKKATIDSYMHWHHTGIRNLARLTFPLLRPEKNATLRDSDKQKVNQALDSFENGWLVGQNYIAGGNGPSIADILAYEEVIGILMGGLFPNVHLYPNIQAWVERMKMSPFHEEAHVALETLGDLSVPSDVLLMKRLSAANKAGVKALMLAQEGFHNQISKL